MHWLIWYIRFCFPTSSLCDFSYCSRFRGCSADSDQMASLEASCSGSTWFSKVKIFRFNRTKIVFSETSGQNSKNNLEDMIMGIHAHLY